MFGELPKLLGRNFAIAFLLPVTLTLILGVLIWDSYTTSDIISWFLSDLVVGTTAAGFVCWLVSVSLLVTNRELYRVLEGYGRLNPIRLFGFLEKARYESLLGAIAAAKEKKEAYRKKGQPLPASLRLLRNQLQENLAEGFPDKSELLLPTAFGNTMRAFETYPRAMYGIEGVDGWDRLLGVIPQDYRTLIDDAKSHVDFWINMGFLGTFLYILNIYLMVVNGNLPAPVLFLAVLLMCLMSPLRARRAAAEWGSMIKSAFDLYLPALREKLEMKVCYSREEEIAEWVAFSQAVVYRLPDHMPDWKRKNPRRNQKHS